jgi:hypothetical protein
VSVGIGLAFYFRKLFVTGVAYQCLNMCMLRVWAAPFRREPEDHQNQLRYGLVGLVVEVDRPKAGRIGRLPDARAREGRKAKEEGKTVVVSGDIEWTYSLWVKHRETPSSLQCDQKMRNKFGEIHVHAEAVIAKEYWQVERVLNNGGFECLTKVFAAGENIGAAMKVS